MRCRICIIYVNIFLDMYDIILIRDDIVILKIKEDKYRKYKIIIVDKYEKRKKKRI